MPACAPSYFVYRTPYGPMTIRASAKASTTRPRATRRTASACHRGQPHGHRAAGVLRRKAPRVRRARGSARHRRSSVPCGTSWHACPTDETRTSAAGGRARFGRSARSYARRRGGRATGTRVAVLVPDHRVVGARRTAPPGPSKALPSSRLGPCSQFERKARSFRMNVYVSEHPCRLRRVRRASPSLVTVPYMIYQYRKFGSVPWLRTLVVYSFAFYLLCAYFLVLLPLPADRTAFVPYAADAAACAVQLRCARSLRDDGPFGANPATWLGFARTPAVYEAFFNLLLTRALRHVPALLLPPSRGGRRSPWASA